ncbi:hypothetical protein COTS27_01118 [Spirochaetota bacterium]|nr:hypothetical protein COTS27_01118 [Spirochaetota bacterium]
MKRTELDRKERDLRKEHKRLLKESTRENSKKRSKEQSSVNITLKTAYDNLINIFEYDEEEIYNIHKNNEDLVEILLEMQESFEDKDVAATIRKAIKRTRIKNKEQAFKAVYALLE